MKVEYLDQNYSLELFDLLKLLTYFFFVQYQPPDRDLASSVKNDKWSMSGFALNFINGLVFVSSSLTKTCGRDQNYFGSF